MSANSNTSIPSDRDVLEGTGRHPDEWFAFLDMAGAARWPHADIVGWFATNAEHLSDEWAASIAARYAAVRGLPVPE
ncbi:MAG: 4-diphosphocytidyl-2C-methyl-D-erythritol kinase [Rhodoglobus sp.]